MATQVVPDSEVLSTSMALAAQLANGAVGAFGEVKRLLLATQSLETQLEVSFQWKNPDFLLKNVDLIICTG